MKHLTLFRWAAALALTLALAPAGASAADDDTLTITGPFRMDKLDGTVGEDLAGVFARGGDHTWTLTLHGVTWSHHRLDYKVDAGTCRDYTKLWTQVHAASFDLQFDGPDAAVLNQVVGSALASDGPGAVLHLENAYRCGVFGWSVWWVLLPSRSGAEVSFSVGEEDPMDTPLPTGADGYPVVPAEWIATETRIFDGRGDTTGALYSLDDLVQFSGGVGSPAPVSLRIQDVSVFEGDRGSRKIRLYVSLTNSSDQTVTAGYRTVDGTAIVKSDFVAGTGTVTFLPGETLKTITLSVKGDRSVEPDEAFTVELVNPVGATIADGSATVTIRNDD